MDEIGEAQLRQLLADESDAAEASRTADPAVTGRGTRPNRPKSAMFSLRLRAEELAEIQRAAARLDVPASALVRGWIVQRLAAERPGADGPADLIDRIENDVRALRQRLAS